MSSRADDKYRSENRATFTRDEPPHRPRNRPERDTRDVKGKDRLEDDRRGRSRSRSASPVRRRSRSPRRRPRSRSTSITRRRSRSPRRRSRSDSRFRHRQRSYSYSPDDRGKRRDHSRDRRRRSRTRSRSVSSSSSSSSDHRHHRKKDRHQKRKRSRSRDKKERKKEKKDKKKKKAGAIGHQWGKYGIISETDLFTKEPEFRAWLVEERMINPETISKDQTRKEFAKFVEDYNTATLSHEKFYNIASYEMRMAAMRSGEFVPPQDDGYDPNADLRALQGNQREKRKAKESEMYMTREQLMDLRKVQAERIEAGKMKLLGMELKPNMGVRMDGSQFDE